MIPRQHQPVEPARAAPVENRLWAARQGFAARYHWPMTEHAYELPPDDTAPADAVHEAASGEVVYLTRSGIAVAALVPADAAEYLEALEDAADAIAARRALAEDAPSIPAEQVWAELGLDAEP